MEWEKFLKENFMIENLKMFLSKLKQKSHTWRSYKEFQKVTSLKTKIM